MTSQERDEKLAALQAEHDEAGVTIRANTEIVRKANAENTTLMHKRAELKRGIDALKKVQVTDGDGGTAAEESAGTEG